MIIMEKRSLLKRIISTLLFRTAPLIKSDSLFLRIAFWSRMGYSLDLKNPRSFSEKIQWLKLYDRKPIYTKMVDKITAKDYVASIVGEEYIIPTFAVYNNVEEIDWDALPDKFVMKCSHDCGSIIICKDKSTLDKETSKQLMKEGLKRKYYWQNREWPYKNVVPRIIVEQYMEDEKTRELRDYKFFCFDGEVKALFVASERQIKGCETKFDFFDENYNHLPIINGHPNASVVPEKPSCFDEMKEIACKLSKGMPHIRVDLYEMNGKVYFGELTFSHWSGMVPFEPMEWDYIFGQWIKLP